jgi:hypothetical protein
MNTSTWKRMRRGRFQEESPPSLGFEVDEEVES